MLTSRIEQLTIYPVKSLGGIHLQRAQVSPFGLAGDRQWMLVKKDGRFITQRQLPALALIQPFFKDEQLWLRTGGQGEVAVLPPQWDAAGLEVTVWKDTCRALLAGGDVHEWLSEAMGQDLRLVTMAPGFIRPAKEDRFGHGSHTYFADSAPYLVANLASLTALNQHLLKDGHEPVDMRRFRPNIVLNNQQPFAEHHLKELHTATGIRLALKDHCQRCSVITVNPDTGSFSPSTVPFAELALLNPMPDNMKAPAFGVNSTLLAGAGQWMQVGEELSLS